MIMNNENTITIDTAFNKRTTHIANIYFANSPSLHTVKPRFTKASDHEQFGLRTNFPNTKRLG